MPRENTCEDREEHELAEHRRLHGDHRHLRRKEFQNRNSPGYHKQKRRFSAHVELSCDE